MSGDLGGVLPSLVILGSLAVLALWLSASRSWVDDQALLRRAVRVSALAVLAQAAHFSEELATGFDERFPALFGLAPFAGWLFVTFNVGWLAVWTLSVRGLAHRNRASLFPLWFLGIGGLANGLAHPAFALATRGYFPGLFTAPVTGVLGLLLVRGLTRVTRRLGETSDAA